MADISLKIHERDVESARAKLTEDLAVLCSARTVATFTDGLKQEALDTRDAVWEKLKARAAANPAAMLAIAAGLGWRLFTRPPIASALIGLGLFSLWRTSGVPIDKRSSFLQQSAQSLKTQGEDLATAAGGVAADLAAQAKGTVSAKAPKRGRRPRPRCRNGMSRPARVSMRPARKLKPPATPLWMAFAASNMICATKSPT